MGYSGGYADGYADGGAPQHFGEVTFAGAGQFTAAGEIIFGGAVTFTGAGSFTATGTVPTTIYALASFTGRGSFLPVARFTGTDYALYVVDQAGSQYGQVDNARVGSVTFELNSAGGLSFSVPVTDPDAALCQPGREVQLWRGDQLLFWGPIVRHQIGLDEASWQCAGLFWYFERRYLGRADRVNVLTNGDFEDDETGWTFNNGVTHEVSFTTKIEGAKSLRLEGSAADHVEYASQVFDKPGTTAPPWPGDFLTVAAWVYVPSADYLGGALDDTGLVAVHKRDGVTIGEVQIAEIGDDTIKDQWISLEVGVSAVKGGDTVEVQLYPPHGVAFFDLVTMTSMESLSFGNPVTGAEVDVATVIGGISDYAQQRAPYDWGHGKSDLNIGHAGDPTGETIRIAYQFEEHRNIADAILEYVRRGICDVDFVVTPTGRTFTTYSPRKGHHRADLPLTLDTTVAGFSWSWDGEAAASSVVILGPGDGPDRAEGGAADTTAFEGLTLEWVEVAPDDVTVGDLDNRAAERLRVGVNPTVIEATTLPGVGVIGQLQTGDTVPVTISHGPLDVNDVYRAVRISVDPHTDQATVTLNVEV